MLAANASRPQEAVPGYTGLDTRADLRRKLTADQFARLLDAQLPRRASVLDIGCGAGQLANFLGLAWRRTVIGADIALPALRRGEAWRTRFSVGNARFVAADLFAPPFAEAAFDVVIADRVLDRIADAAAGFRAIARLVRPGGYLAVGVANRLAWHRWMPQPRPVRYSLRDMLGWFAAAGFDFTASLPTIGDRDTPPDMPLFAPQPAGGAAACLSSEVDMALSGGYDGRCIVVGRRRDRPTRD
jgi:SAM-dependent methyltransferase